MPRIVEMLVMNIFSSVVFFVRTMLVVMKLVMVSCIVRFLVLLAGVSQSLAREGFNDVSGSLRQCGRWGSRVLLVRMTVIIVFQIFENVADVEKGIAV
jgi:hypothetical protein